MTFSKTVYLRDELLAIAVAVRDVKPTTDEAETYSLIHEGEPRFAAGSAPSAAVPTVPSKGSRVERPNAVSSQPSQQTTPKDPMAALNARFSAERKWDKEDSSTNRGRGGRGGTESSRSGPSSAVGSASWRGGRDRETFEEGYLYELKQNAKHKQVLQSTVEKYEALRQKEEETAVKKTAELLAAELDAEAARPGAVIATAPGAIDELDAMFSRLRAKEGDTQGEGDLSLVAPVVAETTETSKKRSRFFSAESSDTPPPAVASTLQHVPSTQPAAASSLPHQHHVDPYIGTATTTASPSPGGVVDELLLAPSSNVVWNRNPADLAGTKPAGQHQQPPSTTGGKPQSQPPSNANQNNRDRGSGGGRERGRGGKTSEASTEQPSGRSQGAVTSAASPGIVGGSQTPTIAALSKITIGVQPTQQSAQKNAKSGNQRVWSAADLESKLLGQQPTNNKPVTLALPVSKSAAAAAVPAAAMPQQSKTNMGVYDASDLESALLGAGSTKKHPGESAPQSAILVAASSAPAPRSQQQSQPLLHSLSATPPQHPAAALNMALTASAANVPGGRLPVVVPSHTTPSLVSPSTPPAIPAHPSLNVPQTAPASQSSPPNTMMIPAHWANQYSPAQYAQLMMAAPTAQRGATQPGVIPGMAIHPANNRVGPSMTQAQVPSQPHQSQWVVQQPSSTTGPQAAMRTTMLPIHPQMIAAGFAPQQGAAGGFGGAMFATASATQQPISGTMHPQQFAMIYGQHAQTAQQQRGQPPQR
mmetsp:Transcript_6222/g.6905  ORF Transcript_6222/g.6905 Transcript_6222/m.6905 type:complete len:760 (+) Transcript_6222:432-2711(+)